MTNSSNSPAYGRRLLPTLIDEVAKQSPDKLYGIITAGSGSNFTTHDITYRDLSIAISRAAWWFEEKLGGRGSNFPCIAYSGPNDPRYLIFFIAANKAGYKILFSSPRNSVANHIHILNESQCSIIFRDRETDVRDIQTEKQDLKDIIVPPIDYFLTKDTAAVKHYPYHETENSYDEPTVILHSSGSTGPPKIITWTHEVFCKIDAQHHLSSKSKEGDHIIADSYTPGTRLWSSFPLFHATALLFSLGHTLYYDQVVIFAPAGQIKAGTVLDAIDHLDLKLLLIAPSVLEDLSEDETALQKLQGRELCYGGSPLSENAGNRLSKYAQVTCMIGTTESGEFPILTHLHDDWDYLHFPSSLKGMQFRKHDDQLYELVFVRDQESDQYHSTWITFPDLKEYSTKDLYSKHPTKPNLWKHRGRSDDTIALSNGEKFVPTPYELRLRTAPEIKDTFLVGQGRPEIAVLMELNDDYQGLSSEELLQKLMPHIKQINKDMPKFAKMSRDRLMFTTKEKPMVRAGKGSAIRKATLKLYEKEIAELYESGAQQIDPSQVPLLKAADTTSTAKSLASIFVQFSDLPEHVDEDKNFFELGFDSLNVMQAARTINAVLQAEGSQSTVTGNLIYSHPTIRDLAETIRSLQNEPQDQESLDKNRLQQMEDMLVKYSNDLKDVKLKQMNPISSGVSVILTGSTGSLGSYLLDTLVRSDAIDTIYALNRSENARTRQVKAMSARSLDANFDKVRFIQADLSKPDLGISHEDYTALKTAHLIIHNQWAVDFNLSLSSMEPHVAGIRHLIDLAIESTLHPYILFTSSVGTLGLYEQKHPEAPSAPEAIFSDSSVPFPLGYTMAKQIGERLLDVSAQKTGLCVGVARLGQIAGPVQRKGGVWNKQEWLPSMVISSTYLKKLPSDLSGAVDWLPVDILADTLIDLSLHDLASPTPKHEAIVYNLINPHHVEWSELVPTILQNMPEGSKQVTLKEWIQALKESADNPDLDVVRNPAVKLLDFYENLSQGASTSAKMQVKNATENSTSFKTIKSVNAEWMESWMAGWNIQQSKRTPDPAQKLHGLYTHWATLRKDSADQEFAKFGDFFSEDALAWLGSMRNWPSPSRGRQEIIDYVKQETKTYHFVHQEFLSEFCSQSDRKATVEIKARLSVLNHILDNAYETAIATFDDQGLISDLKVYTCRSAVQLVKQHVSGSGPYNAKYQKDEWEYFFGNVDMKESEAEGVGSGSHAVSSHESCCN